MLNIKMSARRVPRSTPRRRPAPTRRLPHEPASGRSARKRRKSGSPAPRKKARRKKAPRSGTQLSLSGRGSWGGYRAGAGRKRIPRDRRGYVPHTRRPKVTKSTPVHATLRCVEGLPSLRRKTHQAIIERIFAEENRRGFRLVHYSIQGNHLHLIAEGDNTVALSRGMQRLASRIARTLNKRWGRKGKLFRERFDGKVISTPRQMKNALRYVLLNHHKHAIENHGDTTPGLDRCSSGHLFDGWLPLAGRTRPKHRRPKRGDPVVPPTCWLLTKGWRKHGELRPSWV